MKPQTIAFVARAVVGVGLIVGAGWLLHYMQGHKPQAASSFTRQMTRKVATVTAQTVMIAPRWSGYGTARAMTAADIAAEVAAVVVERPDHIEDGAFVQAGELLIRLDDTDFAEAVQRSRHTIESYEAQIAGLLVEQDRLRDQLELAVQATGLARDELERLRTALQSGGAKEVEVERMEREVTRVEREESALQQQIELIPTRRSSLIARMASERAGLHITEKNLARTRITAPFAGYLQQVNVDVGEHIRSGVVVARLVDLSRIEVPLRIPVSAAGFIHPQDEVRLHTDAATDADWEGRVVRIAPEADPRTRTITVYVEVAQGAKLDGGARLLPGQFILGTILGSHQEPVVLVPRRSVVEDRVLVADDDGRVLARSVDVSSHVDGAYPRIDPIETEWAVISSGLSPGDRVIVTNLDELEPGMRVEAEQTDTARQGMNP
ncbi:MAG: efflux RND transporter periplasmic adaptor subunit [Phycisphaerales bacterium]|nr:efflux RND transporter periplasmic adaptor subunit [Phycisphaerales bacterium]